MNSSLSTGEKYTGSWKIEDDKLRLDMKDTKTQFMLTQFFRIYDLKPDSFMMVLTIKPHVAYHAVRIKQ